MKRFFSKLLPAVLGMALLSSVTVFAQVSEDAKAVYEQVMAKSESMDESNMYMHMNMNMSDGTDTINMTMDMNMLFKNMTKPEQMQYLSQAIMTMDGQQMSLLSWYSDGYSYSESGGQKVKVKMDMAGAMDAANASTAALNTSVDFFSDLSIKTVGDTRVLSYTMDNAKINEYIKQVFSQMGFDTLFAGMQFNVRDIKGDYTLAPDNTYTYATISMTMDAAMEGESITATVDGQIAILNPGQPIELSLPSPADYTEIVPGQTAA